MRRGLKIFNIEIGLVEAVKQHEGVGASVVETLGHVGHRTKEWGQLNGDRDFQADFYLVHEFAITVLNVITTFARIGFERVEVELEGVSASLLNFAGIAN